MQAEATAEHGYPYPVVAIGASAGGVEAVGDLLQGLPDDTGAAFVVVLHLDPYRESHLAEVLGRRTNMPVVQIEDRILLQPDRIHVIAPNQSLAVEGRHLRLKPPGRPRELRHPVDELFQSLAETVGDRAVAIVLSGTGSNGSAALAEIKVAGGIVLAQQPETAAFAGMPSNAINTGHVDRVLPPAALADTVAAYIRSRFVAEDDVEAVGDDCFPEVLDLLRSCSRVDLQSYRRPTLVRRINRRMGLKGLRKPEDYLQRLREDPVERELLSRDLMISVTSFFRDPDSWEAMSKHVIEPLVQSKKQGGDIRCWVTACSSGEEAYTLAMLLVEHAAAADKELDIRVFATDLSQTAVGRARLGVFPAGITGQVSPERLARFFDPEGDYYRVSKQTREKVVFAPHNLLSDPPFSHLDIATCRNVLIYLEPEVQWKVLRILHFALRPGGALMLGSAESTHRDSALFEPLNPRHKLYRRAGPARGAVSDLLFRRGVSSVVLDGIAEAHASKTDLGSTALKAVAGLIPAAALLDARHRVVYFHGKTDPYLAHPHGHANLEVYGMARSGLEAPLRAAIAGASQDDRSTTTEASMMRGKAPVRVTITATPLRKRGFILLSFRDANPPPSVQDAAKRAAVPEAMSTEVLQEELRRSNEDLARTIEDLERSNEDLTASSEEVMSVNEELQSTNEELETSKEELQSLNEELATVNAQLQNKLDELETTTSNLTNLLKSSDIATLFLSPDMNVRWFTPAVARLFSLIETDVGRPIADFAQKFDDEDIIEDCRQVIKTLRPVKKEIRDEEGHWYLRRISAYRTAEDEIDGVVLTFMDITNLKETQRKLRSAANRARKATTAKDMFLARLSHELRTPLQPVLLGLSGIATRNDLPEVVAERVANITRNLKMEMRLIDDLLDLTRIGQGQLQLNIERIDAFKLIRDSTSLCRDDSARKKQDVVVEGRPGECVIEGDRLRLQQVIWNLLNNAIRFTGERGTIRIGCESRDGMVFLEVSDDGAGIPSRLLPRIFDSFQRFDDTLSGLGLGLSIAKSIVEAHGGTIKAASGGPGRGATFQVRLPASSAGAGPASEPPDEQEHATRPADIAGLRILVIEDHHDSALMLASLLQAAGCRTETAESMEEALQAILDQEFDLILSDLGLPDGSGYLLIENLPSDVPVIALSGFGSPQDKQRTANAGFVEHLVKPITLPELRAAIGRAMKDREHRPD